MLGGVKHNLGIRGPHRICLNCKRHVQYFWWDENLSTVANPNEKKILRKMEGEPYLNAYQSGAIDIYDTGLGEGNNVGKKVLEYLEKIKDDRFFLFVQFYDPDTVGHIYGENSKEYSNAIILDDEWFPNKLQRQMEVFKNAPLEVGVVYTGGWLIRNNKRIYLPLFTGKRREGNIYKELFEGRIIRIETSTIIVKKECFSRVGMFEERFPCLEDWELWLRISKYYEFKYIDEPLATEYYTPNSISSDLNAHIKARKLILEKHFEEFKKNKKLLARYFFVIGARLCSSEKTTLGRRYFLKSFKTFPLNAKPLLTILISLFGAAFYNKITKLHLEIKKKIINDVYSERILNFLFLLDQFDLTTKQKIMHTK